GQILISDTPTSNKYQLHMEDFANGIYFVNVYQTNQIVKREKVVLNK
ncbi:MAG: T9SS type A sorting domain-containing protein, partial [Bacteroidetes bacterium]|nr:T9SS type A sorting domain-containing protein [Bacteroidota bacterium]